MNSRYLLMHPEWGIFIGTFLGMGLWSKLDCLGQAYAVTFSSATEALEWAQDSCPVECKKMFTTYLTTKEKSHATIAEIVAAGLEGWDPDQEIKNETV